MSRYFIRCCLIAILTCPSLGLAVCPNYEDEQLIDTLESVLLLSEQIGAPSSTGPSRAVASRALLRQALLDSEPELLDAMCDLLSHYPSLEFAVQEQLLFVQNPSVSHWLNQAGRVPEDPADFSCLNTAGYTGLRTTQSVIRIVGMVAQVVCDSNSCWDLVCVPACLIAGAVDDLDPIIESSLRIDDMLCGENHESAMDAFSRDTLGLTLGRGSATQTISDIQALASDTLLPNLAGIQTGVAQQDSLDDAQATLEQEAANTQALVGDLVGSLAADVSRREKFQDDLNRFDIEARLATSLGKTPIGLALPAELGGMLEMVRETVADAITANLNAGNGINQALQFLRDGDAALNQGKYSSAFDSYRNAYLELIR